MAHAQQWHAMTAAEVLATLKSSPQGITEDEATRRQRTYGLNTFPSRSRPRAPIVLARQGANPLILLLVLAAVVAFTVDQFTDAWIIIVTVCITVVFGFVQEWRAEQTLARLLGLIQPTAKVKRNGTHTTIDARNLVPGDIIFIEAGDRIPSDARLFEANLLEVNEAIFTGEALPDEKQVDPAALQTPLADRHSMVWQGTHVVRGEGTAVVVATGTSTELGRIALNLREVKSPPTPLQQNLSHFVRTLSLVVVGFVALIFVAGALRQVPFFEMLLTAVAVAVGAIPEGLPVAVTAILALGARALLERGSLARNLLAVETLGAVTVIAVDKTGTITEGKMSFSGVYTRGDDARLRAHVLEVAADASGVHVENSDDPSDQWRLRGDSTEVAILEGALEEGLAERFLARGACTIAALPFDAEHKYRATVLREGKGARLAVVGAPERLFAHAALDADARTHWEQQLVTLTARGLRVLGVAERTFDEAPAVIARVQELVNGLTFVGFVALTDPLRPGVKEVVEEAQAAGVDIVMITGDNARTARSIAQAVGVARHDAAVLEGSALQGMGLRQLSKALRSTRVFARVVPLDKLRLIEAYQARGEVIAMTGDGVNDAPALKRADIGIAVGSGHDIAKEAASLVILDNNLGTIVHAIEGGRRIFDNVRKVVTYLLFGSFSEVIVITSALIAGLPLPLLPAHILWVNIIEDTFPAFAFAFEPGERGLMREPPRKKNAPLITQQMWAIILLFGVVTSALVFGLYVWLISRTNDIAYVRTMVFVSLGIETFFVSFALRSFRRSVVRMNPLGNKPLLFSLVISLLLYLGAIYFHPLQTLLHTVPLSLGDWGLLGVIGVINLIVVELIKWAFRPRPLLSS